MLTRRIAQAEDLLARRRQQRAARQQAHEGVGDHWHPPDEELIAGFLALGERVQQNREHGIDTPESRNDEWRYTKMKEIFDRARERMIAARAGVVTGGA